MAVCDERDRVFTKAWDKELFWLLANLDAAGLVVVALAISLAGTVGL